MTQMLISPDVQVTPELLERCDRCGAAAKAHVVFASTTDLAFCGHHANRYAEQIVAMAKKVILEEGYEWRGTAG